MEHLLAQNKELLSHLQILMTQLAQIQTLQQSLGINSSNSQQGAAAPTDPVASPPVNASAPSDTNTISNINGFTAAPSAEAVSTVSSAENATSLSPAPTMDQFQQIVSSPEQQAPPPPNADMTLDLDLSILGGPATNDPFMPQASSSLNATPISTN